MTNKQNVVRSRKGHAGAFAGGAIVAASMFTMLGVTSQPDPDDMQERIKRIERGLFQRNSRLPESELESLEQLVRDLPKITVGTANDHSAQLDQIERVLRDVERKVGDIDRDISRADPGALQRELDALERELTEAERDADDARRRAQATERELSRLERRVSALERGR